MPAPLSIDTLTLDDDGIVPNNPKLPLVLYRGALGHDGDLAASCAAMFTANGWPHPWRNGIYGHHHYHSTAHEVLGIVAGSARVQLGGASGPVVALNTGDVVVIPAGVAHKRESASADLVVIGAYPTGQQPDLCRADPGDHDRAAARVARVPLPQTDPVTGRADPLIDCWRTAAG